MSDPFETAIQTPSRQGQQDGESARSAQTDGDQGKFGRAERLLVDLPASLV